MASTPPTPLHLAQHAAADELLSANPLALLIAMVLDQQIPMERAFLGPYVLAQRLDGVLEAGDIATRDAAEFTTLAATEPAIHRFPASMATRIQALCRHVIAGYDGRAERVWEDAVDGADLQRRLIALPGFGAHKAKVFAALLGKQLGVRPPGWRAAAAPYSAPGVFHSLADVTDADSIERVREHKRAVKRAAKGG